MASGGLSSVRDALLTASFYDIIDDDEFVLLYDAYSSKPIFPYWKFPRFSVDEWSDVECKTELRFAKKHLPELCKCLEIPEKITCVQRTVCGGMNGLCILLKRLAYPCSYTARPQENQRVMYNGHKRIHSIKFQSVVIPNGLIANLHGPFEGKRHDSTMLQQTGTLNELRKVAFHNGHPFCLYGDPSYPLGVNLQAPFKNIQLTPQMVFYNATMSEVRVAVEWLFGNITNYFKFIYFKSQLQINMSSVGKFYIVCAFLENALTCLYGNIVLEKFEVQPPSLQDYFQ